MLEKASNTHPKWNLGQHGHTIHSLLNTFPAIQNRPCAVKFGVAKVGSDNLFASEMKQFVSLEISGDTESRR